MENNIPSSFIGYKKEVVDNILSEKNTKLETQQQDIDYLRNQLTKLEKKIKKNNSTLPSKRN